MANIKLKGNPIETNGQLPKEGSEAPDFVLVDQELGDHTLKDYQGKKKILSINPSLDTSVCSTVAKKFNEKMKKEHPDALILVITADLPFAQKRFCNQEKAENIVTLSMMRNKDFAKDYGILMEDGPLAGLCARAVLVLDENNRVLYSELVPEITQEPDYQKALSHLD